MFSKSLCDHTLNYKNINVISHSWRYFINPSYRIIWLFRLGNSIKNKLLKKLFNIYYKRQCNRFNIFLDLETDIKPGLDFVHNGPIVINPSAKIGKNAIIHPCVLIGGDRKTGAPSIGDNVFIGHGTKIIGHCKIGDNVFIAPASVITKDIESDCIVGTGLNNVIRYGGGN